MSGLQESLCRLCRTTITDKCFEVIDDATKDILHVLLLKLKLDGERKEVICNACRRKLNTALKFKSTCLDSDNTIIPHVDCEGMLQLDIREVYLKEKGSKTMDISDSQKICRLCMQPVETEFRCIREEECEAIEKLAPQMIINIIKDPVVCKPCFDSLCTHNSFLGDCLETEGKISEAKDSQIETSPSLFIKTENLYKKFDINKRELSIKDESVDIKSEDEESSDALPQSSDNGPSKNPDCKDVEEDVCKHEIGSERESEQEHKVLYKCDKCIYETESTTCFAGHCVKHENDSVVYRCDWNKYETGKKELLQKDLLEHQASSQVQMYRCKDCDYETRHKYNIKQHQLKHKDPSQIQMYSCKDCDYETKYRRSIKRHQLKHTDSSQAQMYRCNNCDFQTKYKEYIKQHQLKHKDPSQVQMYRCANVQV
ncbi:zinc finger protein 11-like [Anoplophora glabripennis]|uniref:zinc finger protein 11-like n=1 Tax=Anoplophora glabripennis TaxID=217634 RepID=UPI000C755B43|nr:zinc finger protein 11-like [Anoplophora glabripennis]